MAACVQVAFENLCTCVVLLEVVEELLLVSVDALLEVVEELFLDVDFFGVEEVSFSVDLPEIITSPLFSIDFFVFSIVELSEIIL